MALISTGSRVHISSTQEFEVDWLARAAVSIFSHHLIRMIILDSFVSLYNLLRIYGTD